MRVPGGFSTQVAGGFALIVVILGGAAAFSVGRLDGASHDREEVTRRYVGDLIYAERLRSAEEGTVAAGRGFLITQNPDHLLRLQVAEGRFESMLSSLPLRVRSPADREQLAQMTAAARDFLAEQHQLLYAGAVDAHERVHRFEREVVPKRRTLDAAIDGFVAYKERRVEEIYGAAHAEISRAATTVTIALSLALLLGAAFAGFMGRHLTRAYRREERAVRAAERALAAKQELLGIVAHDLRSPLGAITLKAGFLQRWCDDERIIRQSQSIERVALQMEQIIAGLLDAAQIEAGRFSVQRTPEVIDDVLHEASEMLTALAASRSIRLDLRIDPPQLAVLIDRPRLLQVLSNIIGNAIKFSAEGSTITVVAARDGDNVRLSIGDQGPGIAPDHLPHVFDRFWKSGGNGGTGLGLYIAKGIVEAHGGRLWVHSAPPDGATFCFTLPGPEASAPAARSQTSGHPPIAA